MRSIPGILAVAAVVGTATFAHGATTAEIDNVRDKGLGWLVQHQRGDGSWRSVNGPEALATATAIEAFGVANVKTEPYVAGVAWLANATVVSVDSLARQVAALAAVGMSPTGPAQQLIGWRNATLGWGAYEGFDTTYPDTALALSAIRAASVTYSDADLKAGLCRLLVGQKTGAAAVNGSWSWTYADANGPANAPGTQTGSAILPTVYNLLEVHAIRLAKGWTTVADSECAGAPAGTTYTLTTVVNNALTWLTTQRRNADGGFGEGGASSVLETALAYYALGTVAPTDAAAGPALDYLVLSTQRPDGSWNGDAFQTALVLKVIPIGTPYSDADQDGLPDRVETQLGTNPAIADSRWIAPNNSLTSLARPSPANQYNVITAVFAPSGRGGGDITGLAPTIAAPGVRPARASRLGDRERGDPLSLAVSADGFKVDIYTGAAIAELPIAVPPGAGGVAPSLVLRYDSLSADALTASDPAQGTGLGWTLIAGPVIVRDHKSTIATTDDTFALLLGGKRYDLVLIDSAQSIYHTKDDLFLKVQYTSGTDTWTVTTKDGTRYTVGGTTDSRQRTVVVAPWTTSVTYRYFPSAVTSTSNVVIEYAYTKDTATVGGQSYDQSIYLDTITYAKVGAATLGAARQLTFLWSARTDWPAAGSTPQHFEKKKLDWIDIRLGGNLVRTYGLTYDYTSIDRAAGAWTGGGATGDLALRTVTLFGTDAATALPTATFNYHSASGRLTSATNGFGGQVTYAYNALAAATLYSVCSTSSCADRGVCNDANPAGYPAATLLGYLLSASAPDTVPIYSVCKTAGSSGCADWGAGNAASGSGPTLLGYGPNALIPGTIGLYSVNQGGWKAVTATAPPAGGTLLGYVYLGNPNRFGRVISRSISDGRTPVVATSYSYRELALNGDGTARGYEFARATDPTGVYTDTYFFHSDDASGRAYQIETRDVGNALLRRADRAWTVSHPYPSTAPSVTLATLTLADDITYDGAVTLTTRRTWQYDAYANVTSARVEGYTTVTGDEREERIDWVVDETTWMHRPTRIASQSGAGTVLREWWLSYDGAGWGMLGTRGLVTTEERRITGARGTAGNAVTTKAYDAHGNLTGVTDPGNCTTTTPYQSPSYAVAASSTTCLGHLTTYAYDAYERRTGVTDPNNRATTYTWDAVGRLTRVTGPLDGASANGSVSFQYPGWGTVGSQAFRTLQTKVHGLPTTVAADEFFDGRGRVYVKQSAGPAAGQTIAQAREFDSRGSLWKRTAPYLAGTEAPVWTVYTYDALGRRTRIDYPDTTARLTSYANVAGVGSSVTVTDERGNVRYVYRDAHDQVIRVEEPNTAGITTTTYAYDATGNLVTVTRGTLVTTLGWDPIGRQTSLTDSNLGSWGWAYDTRGNLTSRTDARSQTVSYTYDAQSRVLTKTAGGVQVTWTYDEPNGSAPFTIGRLTTLSDPVSATAFTYDAAGRVTQARRTLDAVQYTLSQSYDARDLVTSRTFPDGDTVSYVYNDAGWLERIVGYVEGTGGSPGIIYDARGQRAEIRYASGTVSTFTYHPQNFRLTRLLTVAPSGTLQNFSYQYDAAGNAVQITDSVGTASRALVYDALHRLIRASGWLNGVTEDYTYDAYGNPVRHASLLYAYSDLAHPWAVTSLADGRAYSYDANGSATVAAGRQLTWDAEGRLRTIAGDSGTMTFDYDPTDRAVRTTTPAGVARSPFPGYEVDPSGVPRKWLGLALKHGSRTRYYHDDHIGSTHVLSDENGFEAQRIEYTPWGEVVRSEGALDPILRFRSIEPAAAYDPALARLLGPIAATVDPSDPQATNPYTYARNNPASLPLRRAGEAEEF